MRSVVEVGIIQVWSVTMEWLFSVIAVESILVMWSFVVCSVESLMVRIIMRNVLRYFMMSEAVVSTEVVCAVMLIVMWLVEGFMTPVVESMTIIAVVEAMAVAISTEIVHLPSSLEVNIDVYVSSSLSSALQIDVQVDACTSIFVKLVVSLSSSVDINIKIEIHSSLLAALQVNVYIDVGASVSVSFWWDSICHLLSEEDLGQCKAKRVSKLIVVLVVPLCEGIHELMIDILAVDNEIVVHMEDEVPWVGEGFAHISKLIEVSSSSSFALLKFTGDVKDDVSEVFDGMEDTIERGVSELVDNSTDSLPDVFGIAEALDSMGNFSFDTASKETFKDLSHSEEGEVDV